MKKILVSACLLGQTVRYDAKHLAVENTLLHQWIQQQRIIGFCPEVASGLPVPRTPAEISAGDGHQVLAGRASVIDRDGRNVTQYFIDGANMALALCQQHRIELAILAQRSPSCGDSHIYNGAFNRTLIEGAGVTAALLQQHGIRVFNQSALQQASVYLAGLEK
ncbi:MAG: DUF523 domain-containing protein [Gammaproteobacteria bacterium]|nr:DUF523 domain-containing protein [Gammaproteobacteria bacterium]MBL7000699.1 DUF523 domain-containing protein [Gammaproteobacteria bacterium]